MWYIPKCPQCAGRKSVPLPFFRDVSAFFRPFSSPELCDQSLGARQIRHIYINDHQKRAGKRLEWLKNAPNRLLCTSSITLMPFGVIWSPFEKLVFSRFFCISRRQSSVTSLRGCARSVILTLTITRRERNQVLNG